MEQLDVFISIKPKPKQPSKSVIVKSVERNAVNMYEARKFLLGLESNGVSSALSPSPTLICPVGLDILASAGLGLSSLGLLGPSAPHSLSSSPAPNSVLNSLNSSMSPLQNPPSPSPSLWPSSLTSTQGFSSQLMMHPVAQATLSSILLSGVKGYTQNTPSPPPGLVPIDKQTNGVPDCSKGPCTLNGHVKVADFYRHIFTNCYIECMCICIGLHSVCVCVCSDTFVEVGMPRSPSHSANGNELKQMLASCKTSGKRHAVELLQGTKNSHLHSDCLLSDPESSASDGPVTDKRAPGSERAAERAAQQNERDRIRLAPHSSFANMQALEYEQKKLLATKAMLKKPVVTEVRTPTNTWSGLGFSKSMPAETIKELRRANHVSYKPTMSTTYEGSPLSLSRSGSREGVGNGSDSDNWRDRNGVGNGLANHAEFPASVSSPKRKQNKSGELPSRYLSELFFFFL
uniref:BicC family RNA binding protein 1 n=1 Tax=Salmo trutta TaxID=8032 RepID=A0A674AKR9_SALTR